jgi:hypothetical protein
VDIGGNALRRRTTEAQSFSGGWGILMLIRSILAVAAVCFYAPEAFAADLSPTADNSTEQPAISTAVATPTARCGALPTQQCDPTIARGRAAGWPEVWGYIDASGIFAGQRMAPNGVLFEPVVVTSINLNIGLLPNKKLYVFTDSKFWMQEAGIGITNPSQGNFDFSKREFDFNAGIAWNYFDRLEIRASAYSAGNLNRGVSLTSPSGFKDGVLLENRYYFGSANAYDVGRLSFVSVGYYPTKSLVGGDGSDFHPGVFVRAYATYDIPIIRSYLYGDLQFTAERIVKPRLLEFDGGLASRPFSQFENLEFRVGNDVTNDVQAKTTRDLVYGAIRIGY